MTWMNEHEIDDALRHWRDHDVLGPASQTLSNLRDVVNRNSDGWPYWNAPAKAATRLMQLIVGDPHSRWGEDHFGERPDATEAALKAAYTPIRSFLTRQGLTCEIVAMAKDAPATITVKRRFAVWLEDAFTVTRPSAAELRSYDDDMVAWATDSMEKIYSRANDKTDFAVKPLWTDSHKADVDSLDDEITVEEDTDG